MSPLIETVVGDKLLVSNPYGDGILTVTHTTKTQVHCGTTKFRRDGFEIGGSIWHKMYARPATEEDIYRLDEQKKRQQAVSALRQAVNHLDDKSTTQIEQALAALQQ